MSRFLCTITACALGGLLTISFLGCGGGYDGPPRAKITGKASFDGTPIANGSITLMPDGHDGRSSSVSITNGEYLIEEADGPNFGKYKVEIYGFEGGVSGTEEEEEGDEGTATSGEKQVVPAKYNTATELSLDVGEAEIQKDFALTP